MSARRESRIWIAVIEAFNDPSGRKLDALVGKDKADEYRAKQHAVASKVHRSPPRSLDGMRF